MSNEVTNIIIRPETIPISFQMGEREIDFVLRWDDESKEYIVRDMYSSMGVNALTKVIQLLAHYNSVGESDTRKPSMKDTPISISRFDDSEDEDVITEAISEQVAI